MEEYELERMMAIEEDILQSPDLFPSQNEIISSPELFQSNQENHQSRQSLVPLKDEIEDICTPKPFISSYHYQSQVTLTTDTPEPFLSTWWNHQFQPSKEDVTEPKETLTLSPELFSSTKQNHQSQTSKEKSQSIRSSQRNRRSRTEQDFVETKETSQNIHPLNKRNHQSQTEEDFVQNKEKSKTIQSSQNNRRSRYPELKLEIVSAPRLENNESYEDINNESPEKATPQSDWKYKNKRRKRVRARFTCEKCRYDHKKCVLRKDEVSCERCRKINFQCSWN